jgi:hypothetical protein
MSISYTVTSFAFVKSMLRSVNLDDQPLAEFDEVHEDPPSGSPDKAGGATFPARGKDNSITRA